jgi:hypothetical protein
MTRDKWLSEIRTTIKKSQLIEIDRSSVAKEKLVGYVVGVSEQFILIHDMCDHIFLNGYAVIRIDDVRRYRILRDWKGFATRALRIRQQSPVPQRQIDLTNWETVLVTANKKFPLITIHRERMDNSVCYIGQVKHRTNKTVTMAEIDPAASWTRTHLYRFRDITMVGFGAAYESALWLVYCKETGNKNLLKKARTADRPFASRSR